MADAKILPGSVQAILSWTSVEKDDDWCFYCFMPSLSTPILTSLLVDVILPKGITTSSNAEHTSDGAMTTLPIVHTSEGCDCSTEDQINRWTWNAGFTPRNYIPVKSIVVYNPVLHNALSFKIFHPDANNCSVAQLVRCLVTGHIRGSNSLLICRFIIIFSIIFSMLHDHFSAKLIPPAWRTKLPRRSPDTTAAWPVGDMLREN